MISQVQTWFEESYVNVTRERDFQKFSSFQYSGLGLVEKIAPDAKILDVGCGYNFLKPYFVNLIGIDPACSDADLQISIDDYQTNETFDVVLCLGSIQFGTTDYVKMQISRVVSMLAANGSIYWRSLAVVPEKTRIPVFEWSETVHKTMAEQFGCKLVDLQIDYFDQSQPDSQIVKVPRLFAQWIKI